MIIVNINGTEYQVSITAGLNLSVANTKYPKVVRGDFFLSASVEDSEGTEISPVVSGQTLTLPDVEVVIDGESLFYPYGTIILNPIVPSFLVAPTPTEITETSFNVVTQSNVVGRIYALNRLSSEPIPSVGEVLNGQSIEENGSGATFEFLGLSGGTSYTVYLIYEDEWNNRSALVSIQTNTSSGISTYYVRPSGSNYGTGDGSSYENAWSGLSSINWNIIGSGDTIIGDGIFNEQFVLQSSGQLGLPILMKSYTTESWIIDTELNDVSNQAISGTNVSNITFEDVVFRTKMTVQADTETPPIFLSNCQNIIFNTGCRFERFVSNIFFGAMIFTEKDHVFVGGLFGGSQPYEFTDPLVWEEQGGFTNVVPIKPNFAHLADVYGEGSGDLLINLNYEDLPYFTTYTDAYLPADAFRTKARLIFNVN